MSSKLKRIAPLSPLISRPFLFWLPVAKRVDSKLASAPPRILRPRRVRVVDPQPAHVLEVEAVRPLAPVDLQPFFVLVAGREGGGFEARQPPPPHAGDEEGGVVDVALPALAARPGGPAG